MTPENKVNEMVEGLVESLYTWSDTNKEVIESSELCKMAGVGLLYVEKEKYQNLREIYNEAFCLAEREWYSEDEELIFLKQATCYALKVKQLTKAIEAMKAEGK